MINSFLALIFSIISFSFFYIGTSVNSINRAMLYFPIEIIQKAVSIIDIENEEDLYFDKTIMELEVQSYFERTIKKSVISYQSSIIFTNADNTMICMGPNAKCKGVKINLEAELFFDIHYEKTMFYSIGES